MSGPADPRIGERPGAVPAGLRMGEESPDVPERLRRLAAPPAAPRRRREQSSAVPANLRRLGEPRPVAVVAGAGGRPDRVDGREVDSVRESWLVEDRWWTLQPIRRRYWEVVTTCGRNVVVFHELEGEGWFLQRG